MKIDGRRKEVWDRTSDNREMGKFLQYLIRTSLRPQCNSKREILSTQEDHRARFFECYRQEAEEYDREFMKKYDEDLNTTLIFVSFMKFQQACAKIWSRLVSFPPLLPHSSSTSNLNSSLTRVRRLLPSSESSSIRLTMPPSVTTLPPFPNGMALHTQLFKSKPSFTQASLLPSSLPSSRCSANNG